MLKVGQRVTLNKRGVEVIQEMSSKPGKSWPHYIRPLVEGDSGLVIAVSFDGLAKVDFSRVQIYCNKEMVDIDMITVYDISTRLRLDK